MSILSNWFKKESTKVVLKSALSILKVIIGKSADEVWKRTTAAVLKAEQMPLTGPQKAQYVLNDLKSSWGDVKGYISNLILELAVTYVKEGMIKR